MPSALADTGRRERQQVALAVAQGWRRTSREAGIPANAQELAARGISQHLEHPQGVAGVGATHDGCWKYTVVDGVIIVIGNPAPTG